MILNEWYYGLTTFSRVAQTRTIYAEGAFCDNVAECAPEIHEPHTSPGLTQHNLSHYSPIRAII